MAGPEYQKPAADSSMAFSVKLVMPSHPRVLSVVRSTVGQFALVMGFTEEECRSIVLAVDESLANVIRHAYHNEHDRQIVLTCRRIGPEDALPGDAECEGLEFILVDHGSPAAPGQLKGRELDDVRPGGLGLHLITQIMDVVQYEPQPGHNQLRLVKNRTRKPAGGE